MHTARLVCAELMRRVLTKTRIGSTRVVDVLMGELLARIYWAMKLILK